MCYQSVTDPSGNFAIHLIDRPLGMLGTNSTSQDHSRGLPHAASNTQSFYLSLPPKNVCHIVVHHFHEKWIHYRIDP
jgi:hypothetical protein